MTGTPWLYVNDNIVIWLGCSLTLRTTSVFMYNYIYFGITDYRFASNRAGYL